MRKILVFLLIALLLPVYAQAEEEGGTGTIVFLDIESDDSPVDADNLPVLEPYAPDNVEKTILWPDDRIQVSYPMGYPFCAIAYIIGYYNCGCCWETTGFMITRDALMSTAHTLVCPKHNAWANAFTFYFGYKSQKEYFYKYNGHWTAWAGTYFANGYTDVEDWGCIHFDDAAVGDITGWFGIDFNSDRDLEAGTYIIAGYKDGKLKYDIGRVRVIDENRMWIDADTECGNSGGPVYRSDNYAVGFFTTNYSDANSGYRMNPRVWSKLQAEGLL